MGRDPTHADWLKIKAILDRKGEKPLNLVAEAALYLFRQLAKSMIEETKPEETK